MTMIKLYYDIRLLFLNYIRFSFQTKKMQQDNLNIKVMHSKERDAISTPTNYFCYRTLQLPEFILLSFLQSQLLEHGKLSFSFLMHEKVTFQLLLMHGKVCKCERLRK